MDKKILKEKLDALREKEGQLINHIEAMHTKPSHLVRRDRVYTLIKKNAAMMARWVLQKIPWSMLSWSE